MQIYTHYSVRVMDGGGLARGMYTCSTAYDTPELAREFGPQDGVLKPGRLALCRVETRDAVDSRGKPYRSLVRETIMEVLPLPE